MTYRKYFIIRICIDDLSENTIKRVFILCVWVLCCKKTVYIFLILYRIKKYFEFYKKNKIHEASLINSAGWSALQLTSYYSDIIMILRRLRRRRCRRVVYVHYNNMDVCHFIRLVSTLSLVAWFIPIKSVYYFNRPVFYYNNNVLFSR